MADVKRSWLARFWGWFLLAVGYILSPLSWWNDLVVNWPLAYLFANLVSLASRRLFPAALIAGYWLTNVAGLVMMYSGSVRVATANRPAQSKRRLWISLAFASGYTVLAIVLLKLGLLRPVIPK